MLNLFSFIESTKPHERRGRRRSVFTVWREIIRSHSGKRPEYFQNRLGMRNKGYAKQAKGFREWKQTPTQLARLNANLGRANG